jgi:hypothetical protein
MNMFLFSFHFDSIYRWNEVSCLSCLNYLYFHWALAFLLLVLAAYFVMFAVLLLKLKSLS